MDVQLHLDNRLVRSLHEGIDVLPDDLGELNAYLRTITNLLEEKAGDLEPSWEMLCSAAAEIETLQELESTVTERVIAVRSRNLDDVRGKLEFWRALAASSDDCEMTDPRNRLILSIEADLERLTSSRC